MTESRPPPGHVIARAALGLFVVLFFLTVLGLVVYWRAAELGFGRAMAAVVRSWLL